MLLKEEEVLTRGDPRHRYNIGAQTTDSLRAWVRSLPRYHDGGVVGGDGGYRSGGGLGEMNVSINLQNNSNTNLAVTSVNNEQHGRNFILGVVIDDISRGGAIARSLQATSRR